ncbi:hypothetical protein LCGC14_0578870 [marine sediment metagenome]|uniref:Uncharacterized protein n=1 Tax=marine sediment metagenome TaxID=412755 RepID=A0A0F9RH43_9ZZZZ|nr:hypothetical protein [bacterium]
MIGLKEMKVESEEWLKGSVRRFKEKIKVYQEKRGESLTSNYEQEIHWKNNEDQVGSHFKTFKTLLDYYGITFIKKEKNSYYFHLRLKKNIRFHIKLKDEVNGSIVSAHIDNGQHGKAIFDRLTSSFLSDLATVLGYEFRHHDFFLVSNPIKEGDTQFLHEIDGHDNSRQENLEISLNKSITPAIIQATNKSLEKSSVVEKKILKELLHQEVQKDKQIDLIDEIILNKLDALIQKKINDIYTRFLKYFNRRFLTSQGKIRVRKTESFPKPTKKTSLPVISKKKEIDFEISLPEPSKDSINQVIESDNKNIIIKKEYDEDRNNDKRIDQSKSGIENYIKDLSSNFILRMLKKSYASNYNVKLSLIQEKRRIVRSMSPESKKKYTECFNNYFSNSFNIDYERIVNDLCDIDKPRYRLVSNNQNQDVNLGCCIPVIFLIVVSILFGLFFGM